MPAFLDDASHARMRASDVTQYETQERAARSWHTAGVE
jgi:hypothetical protein